MAGTLVQLPRQSPLNGGTTVPGGKLFVYDAGTSTKRAIYTTSALAVQHPNPLVADANGRFAAAYVESTDGDYKEILAGASDSDPPTSPYWTEDNIPVAAEPAAPRYDVTTAETYAGVTPTNDEYPAFHVDRYGADPTGASDSSPAFQSAVSVAEAMGNEGAEIVMGAGTYKISSLVTAPGRVLFRGQGMNATRINAGTGVNPLKFVNTTPTNEIEGGGIIDCSISHDTCTVVCEFVDVWGARFERVRVRDGGSGSTRIIKGSGECFELKIRDNRMVGASTYGIDLIDECNSCIVSGNDFAFNNGCTALRVKGISDVCVENNRFEYAGSDAGVKIELDDAINTVIRANHIEAATSGYCIVQKGSLSSGTKITENAFSTSGAGAILDIQAGDYGIFANNKVEVFSTTIDQIKGGGRVGWVVANNTINVTAALPSSYNLILLPTGSTYWSITGNVFSGSGSGDDAATGIQIDAGATWIDIVGNVFANLNTGIDTQANNASPSVVITGNAFAGLTTNITVGTSTSNRIRNNIGYISEAEGATSVADGGTITHGLSTTPTNVRVTPSTSGEFVSVTAISSTTFTVAIKKHDNSSGTTQTVYWEASV